MPSSHKRVLVMSNRTPTRHTATPDDSDTIDADEYYGEESLVRTTYAIMLQSNDSIPNQPHEAISQRVQGHGWSGSPFIIII